MSIKLLSVLYSGGRISVPTKFEQIFTISQGFNGIIRKTITWNNTDINNMASFKVYAKNDSAIPYQDRQYAVANIINTAYLET